MDIVFFIHSLLRFVILVVALAGVVLALVSISNKQLLEKQQRMLAAAFVGLYDLQALVGILLILLGGLTQAVHPLVMLIGVIVAHGLQSMTKREAGPNAAVTRLALFVVPLAIIAVGLASIGHLPV